MVIMSVFQRSYRRITFVGLLATLLFTGALAAQGPLARRIDPATRRAVVTANPFALFAEYIAGDIEVRATPFLTVGAGVSLNQIDDYNNYRAVELKARYYPAEQALQGLSIAATVGVSTANADSRYSSGNYGFISMSGNFSERVTRPSLGTELSYQWIVGPSSRFVAVVGAGVKRMFGKEGTFNPLNIPVLPTARVNIGFAF